MNPKKKPLVLDASRCQYVFAIPELIVLSKKFNRRTTIKQSVSHRIAPSIH
jgi:hypothetical protein